MDFKHAWRAIRRMPVLATVVILSLGDRDRREYRGLLLDPGGRARPLPGRRGRVALSPRGAARRDRVVSGRVVAGVSRPARAPARLSDDLLAYRMVPLTLGEAGRTERASTRSSSPAISSPRSACSRRSAASSAPTKSERPASEPVAVISHDFWHTRLGGAADVVGRTLRVNDQQLTIDRGRARAVSRARYLGLNFDLWVPATMAPLVRADRASSSDRTMRGYA